MDITSTFLETIDCEIDGLLKIKEMDLEIVKQLINEISKLKTKVVFFGVGKSGHICKKVVATMCSLGIPACFIHPVEALHGDLGLVQKDDLVILVSKSGESDELIQLYSPLFRICSNIYTITNSINNSLTQLNNQNIYLPNVKEAMFETIVPSTSTTQLLAFCDALAITVAKQKKFTTDDFSKYHPNGLLGKKLLKVSELMRVDNEIPVINENSTLKEAIILLCGIPIGCISIINDKNELCGVFTDGDLRRFLVSHENKDLDKIKMFDIMTKTPITTDENTLVVKITEQMRGSRKISCIPVVNEKRLLGVLCLVDIIDLGLID